MSANVSVHLRVTPPRPTETWDAARALGAALLARYPRVQTCAVTINANRRDVLRWSLGPDAEVSVHWALVEHTADVLAVLERDPAAWKRLETHLPPTPMPDAEPRGDVHDLAALVESQRRHLRAFPQVTVTWARWPTRAPRRVLRLGSCETSGLIRIHPVLDHATVPDWFVGFVLFHELLHAVYPPHQRGARRTIHTGVFQAAERRHPDHLRARAWETANVAALIRRCARTLRTAKRE